MPAKGAVPVSPQWKVQATKPMKGFSPFVAFCFSINYILGTGFLTMPWAFVQGGPLLSCLVLLIVAVLSDMAKSFVLETMAWAEAMLDANMAFKDGGGNSDVENQKRRLVYSPVVNREMRALTLSDNYTNPKEYQSLKSNNTNTAAIRNGGGFTHHQRNIIRVTKKESPAYLVKERKFEIIALCRVFLGKPGLFAYTIVMSVYIYCVLWAYTSVFSSAMAGAFPLFDEDADVNYTWYALIFSSIVIPLSCLELDEQIPVQVTLSFCRFLMVFLMVLTCGSCAEEIFLREENIAQDTSPSSLAESASSLSMFNPSGLSKMLPIAVFASMYHYSIPGLSHPVAQKQKLSSIFSATCIVSSTAYGIVGCTLAFAFGAHIQQSSNLNWKYYNGGTGVWDAAAGDYVDVALWARAISLFVVCFPALDVMSAFPLNAITLGDSIMVVVYGRNTGEAVKSRYKVALFRLFAAIPPILLALWIRELGAITDYAGTAGFLVTLSIPGLMYIKARRTAVAYHFRSVTHYSTFLSSSFPSAVTVTLFGTIMFFFVLTQTASGETEN